MRVQLIWGGLLMFGGGVAYTLLGDRGAGLAPLMPVFVLLGGVSAAVGWATCDVVAALERRDRDPEDAVTPRTDFVVRRMTLGEVGRIRAWADAEGWNPGTHDGPAFHAADPDGFFVGLLGGEPVACLSCVRYGADFGFLGQYIVCPGHRGRGYGFAVWQAGMAHLAGRNVGLDGVLDQVPNYERSGFRLAHHTTRYAGTGGGDRPAGLVPLADVPFADLAAYDRLCFPAPREAFLRAWVAMPGVVGLAEVRGGKPENSCRVPAAAPAGTTGRGDGALAGYGVLRESADGYKVGPLFADDAATAARLLAGLVAAVPGRPFCVDITDESVQPAGGELVRRFRLTEVFRTARMYTRGAPGHDLARVFGVTSLELG